MKVDLTGKVAVVTGGSGVLGSVMCKSLAAAGAKVAVLGSRLERAQKVAGEIKAQGGTAMAIGANVLDAKALKAAQEEIGAAFGPCGEGFVRMSYATSLAKIKLAVERLAAFMRDLAKR